LSRQTNRVSLWVPDPNGAALWRRTIKSGYVEGGGMASSDRSRVKRYVGSLGFTFTVLFLAFVLGVPGTFAQVADPPPEEEAEDVEHGLPFFDIRETFDPAGQPDKEQLEAIQRLERGGVTVRWDDLFGSPKLFIAYGGALTESDERCYPQRDGCTEEVAAAIAFEFIAAHDDLFRNPGPPTIASPGVAINQDADPGQPIIVGNVYNSVAYEKDAEPPSASIATHVFLEQRLAGLRVFGSVLNFTLDAEGRILIAGARYDANGMPPPPGAQMLDAEEAVVLAAGFAGDIGSEWEHLTEIFDPDSLVRQFEHPLGFNPVTAEPVVFPMPFDEDNRFAWLVVLQVDYDEIYETAIDAVTGDLLYRRNQVHAATPEGTVFTDQNPCVGGDVNGCPLATPETVSFAGWVDGDNRTKGNNANAVHNPSGNDTNEYQPQDADQHFNYTYTDAIRTSGSGGTDITIDRDFVITQAFYYVNMLHQRYYSLGFNEAAGNFQQDNFGNGGAEDDPVLVYVDWGFSANPQVCCNASMWTPADGTSPVLRLRVGLAPDNLNMHRAMNGDTVAHEWAHGLSNRLVGGGNLGSGAQAGAMGEGWSDAVATSLWNDPVYGEYNNGNTNTGIRGVAYDTSTLTYGDLCSSGCQVHNDGRIWATTLWTMRTALRDQHGANLGTTRHERLMVDGMKNTPTSPSYLDARDGILAADVVRYAGANQCLIWNAFAAHGMGFSATSVSNGSNVTESFDVPPECAPVADAGGPYATNEGEDVTLDATGSTDPGGGAIVLYEWDFDNDGQYDDATGPTPSFDRVGQDGVYPVGLRVTNAGGISATASTTVTVHNVLPSVSLNSDAPVDENSEVTVSGVISDPGWLEALTGTIDWGDGPQAIVGTLENLRPDATLSFSMSHTYGDNGVFTATVCGTDDHGTVCEDIDLQIDNVAPTAVIDKSGAMDINGVPAILSQVGEPVDFSGRSTDPGSDDLLLIWDWDDGTTTETMYLVNPPNPDPFPSPSIQPRDVTDDQTHTFDGACYYLVSFRAEDDDGGESDADEIAVVILGDADRARSQGYWSTQLAQKRQKDFDAPTLLCYLSITGFMSQVFHEVVDASTLKLASAVLNPRGNRGTMRRLLEVQLLAAWLNFANGAIGYDELVDTTGDGLGDTPFSEAMAIAEAVYLDPTSSQEALETQKNILERINLRDGG
jgi:hypothetical protein